MKAIYLILISVLICCSCRQIKPVAPNVTVAKPGPAKQEASVINIPIQVELKQYFKDADKSVPTTFEGKEEVCEGTSYSYSFQRNPIEFKGKGKELQFDIQGKYALKMNYCPQCTNLFKESGNCIVPRIYASCGVNESMRRVAISYASAFEIRPDYTLKSITRLKEVIPTDKCEVTVFSFDATDQLMKEVKSSLKLLAADIDKEISTTDIRTEVEKAWKTMVKPLKVDRYGYLYIHPSKISVSDMKFTGSTLNFSLALEAYPRMQLEKSPASFPPLPPLSEYPKNTGFNINLDLAGNYDSLSTLLSGELKGKEIMLKKNRIIIDSAKIFGASDHQLSFEIAFSGKRSGIIYLVGTPTFNPQKQEISFPDLTFDLDTRNALLKSAKWLFNDKITHTIRNAAIYNLSALLKDAATRLELELNRKIDEKTVLEGKMGHVRVESIYPLQTELLIRTNLQGQIKLSVE